MILSTYVNQYKNYMCTIALIFYSVGLWHVASRYTSSSYLSKQVSAANEAIAIKEHEQLLANKLGKQLEDSMANIKIKNTTIYRSTQHELVAHKFYIDCINTPDVVRNIESAIENTGTSPNK